MKKLIAVLLVVVLLLMGCGPEPVANGSADPVDEWWTRVEPHVARFIELDDVASATGRGYLSPVLVAMTDSWVAFSYEDTPEEAMDIYLVGSDYMGRTIDNYLWFMRDMESESMMEGATQAYREFTNVLSEHGLGVHHTGAVMQATMAVRLTEILIGTPTPTPPPTSTQCPEPTDIVSACDVTVEYDDRPVEARIYIHHNEGVVSLSNTFGPVDIVEIARSADVTDYKFTSSRNMERVLVVTYEQPGIEAQSFDLHLYENQAVVIHIRCP